MALYITPKDFLLYEYPGTCQTLRNMYNNFTFKNGGHLFEFQEGYEELVFEMGDLCRPFQRRE